MKQFQFSLNTVLGVRSNEEQMAAERHATAQEALEAMLMQRRLVEEAIESNLAACQQAFDGQVKSGTIAHLQAALKELRAQLEVFRPEEQRLQAEADAKWQELLQARQRREALEKLKNKQHAVHLKHEVHTEQKAIDEMVLLREAAGHNQKL
jgi:flagellar export protein FliJ